MYAVFEIVYRLEKKTETEHYHFFHLKTSRLAQQCVRL